MGVEGRKWNTVCGCSLFSCLFLLFLCSLSCFLPGSVSPLSASCPPDSCDCRNLFSLTSATFYHFRKPFSFQSNKGLMPVPVTLQIFHCPCVYRTTFFSLFSLCFNATLFLLCDHIYSECSLTLNLSHLSFVSDFVKTKARSASWVCI